MKGKQVKPEQRKQYRACAHYTYKSFVFVLVILCYKSTSMVLVYSVSNYQLARSKNLK